MNLAESLDPPVPEEEIAAAAEQPAAEEKPVVEEKAEKQDKPEDDKKHTLVSHAALHAERERRKEIETQLRLERQERQRNEAIVADRLKQLYEAHQQGQQPQAPDEATDPLGAALHGQKLTQQQLRQLQERVAQEDWQRQQAANQQQFVTWAASQAEEFRKETPDFDDAYKHVREFRLGELEAMGLNRQQIAQTLYNDEMWIFQHAAQAGKNPAQLVYAMAQRTGYKPGAKEEADKNKEKIETLQKGLEASKTLGNGGAQAGWPTPEQIANMPEDQFDALKAKLKKQGKVLSDIL